MSHNGNTKKLHYCLDCEHFYNPVNIERHKRLFEHQTARYIPKATQDDLRPPHLWELMLKVIWK